MDAWWSYRPEDLVLYTDVTWYSLLASYHRTYWPWQLLPLMALIATRLLPSAMRPYRGNLLALLLAACWAWVAWAFLHRVLAPVHWIADAYAVAFALQSLLLIAVATRQPLALHPDRSLRNLVAIAAILSGLFVLPCISVFDTRDIAQTELVGATPDATVLVSLGVVALFATRHTWLLLVIPVLWCLVAGVTAMVLELTAYWLLPLAALLVLSTRRMPKRSRGLGGGVSRSGDSRN